MKALEQFLLSSVACAAMMANAVPAMAQTDSLADVPADATVSSDYIDTNEIIVTARFKNESVQDVPQAISAFSDEALTKIAARDITDLAPSTPNVSIQPVATFSNSAAIYIRGLGAQGIESTEESPVGVAIDGVFVTRPVATMLDTFDLERIEVLRGPQGTSFGKNSLAGGIAAYTKNPGWDWGLQTEVTVGNYGRMDARAAINMPIIQDVLAARLVVNKETYDGFFTNRLNGKKIGKQDRLTLRGTVVITPTDNLDINLKAFLVHDRSSAPGGDTGPDRTKLLWTVLRFEEPDDGAFTIGRDFSANHDTDQLGFIGNVGLDLGSWQAKSITGYIETDDFNDSDFDQTEIFFFPTFRLQQHRQFSQELRLQSDFSDRSDALARLSLVLGGYYLNQSFELSQAFPTLPVLLAPTLRFGSQDFVTQSNSAKALFGQAIYGVTDRLNLTFGVRQSWESKDYFRDPTGTLLSPAFFTTRSTVKSLAEMETIANTNLAAGKAFKLSTDRARTTFKGGIDYRLTDDIMVYAGFSQGYKGGGFGARSATTTTAGPTDDNTSELFEAGIKGDFFDNLLRLNLTGFVTKFKKLEFGVFIPNPNVASGQETAQLNIGSATSQGIEMEATLKPTQNFRLSANIGYLDAKYTDFCADIDGPSASPTLPVSDCGAVTRLPNGTFLVDTDQTDLKLVRAPKWQTQVSGEYIVPLGSAGDLSFRAAMQYRSSFFSSVTNEPGGLTGDFVLVDGSVSWQSKDERFRMMIWGKNLTNKTYVSAFTPTAQFFNQRFYGAPRTFGMTVGASF
ncbi:TonB-dependent receptor [Maricaulis salignorans]|uniref:TonB-dependent receptor n=1 Tax=Maricaulis salignorans TaxID=144026 RepID=UPI003A946A2F